MSFKEDLLWPTQVVRLDGEAVPALELLNEFDEITRKDV